MKCRLFLQLPGEYWPCTTAACSVRSFCVLSLSLPHPNSLRSLSRSNHVSSVSSLAACLLRDGRGLRYRQYRTKRQYDWLVRPKSRQELERRRAGTGLNHRHPGKYPGSPAQTTAGRTQSYAEPRQRLKQFRNYCELIKIARCGFPRKKAT